MKQLSLDFKIKIIFLFFTLFLLSSYIFIDKFFFAKETNKVAINNALKKLDEREHVFQKFIENSQNTLFSIRESKSFNDYLLNGNRKEQTVEIFESIAKSNSNFMQLRYIDKNGKEQIRIDRKHENGKTFLIAQNRLQDKKNRYYFSSSKFKKAEQIWFSALDLNIENGKVEVPYRPTIRAILPIENKNEFSGIIIINYFMDGFLKEFTNMNLYDTIISNDKGYSLTHYHKDKSWGFYAKDKYTLATEFKELSKDILNKQVFQTESFVSKKLDVPVTDGIVLILRLNKEYLQNKIEKQNLQYLVVSLIVLLLAIVSIYFVSKTVQELVQNLDKTKKLNEKLEEVNYKLHSILDTSKDGIAVLDYKGNFIFFNKSYEDLTGYSRDELKVLNHIDLVKKDYQTQARADIEQVIKNGFLSNVEAICIKKDGKECISLLSIVKIPQEEQILIVAKDITSLKEQEIKLHTQEDILVQQSKMASMGEMLENIAHQWREPISVITTSATGLKVQKDYDMLSDELLEKGLNSIVKHAEYLSHTIDDFRDFFQVETEKRFFKVSTAINKCLFLISSKLKNRDIEVVINVKNEELLTYKNDFIQVLINIISNAADAIDEKKMLEIRLIQIDVLEEKDDIVIGVCDNAGGVPLSIINRIFNRQFTTKSDANGTGVGLYMAKDMIEEKMGGAISVRNKTFKYKNISFMGACFIISIPKGKQIENMEISSL